MQGGAAPFQQQAVEVIAHVVIGHGKGGLRQGGGEAGPRQAQGGEGLAGAVIRLFHQPARAAGGGEEGVGGAGQGAEAEAPSRPAVDAGGEGQAAMATVAQAHLGMGRVRLDEGVELLGVNGDLARRAVAGGAVGQVDANLPLQVVAQQAGRHVAGVALQKDAVEDGHAAAPAAHAAEGVQGVAPEGLGQGDVEQAARGGGCGGGHGASVSK